MDEWWEQYIEPDGLVMRDKVLADVDPDRLLVAMRSGRLRRVQRGIYVPRTVEYTPVAAARAAATSSGIADAVASHRTAARCHALALPAERRCEDVTVPSSVNRKDRKDLCFHRRGLNLGDVVLMRGVPVSALPRTVADLACWLDRLPAVWLIDDAMRRGLCGRADIISVVRTWRGGAGCGTALRRVREADGRSESVLETAGRLALLDGGVRLPVAQYEVRASDGRLVARLDGAYPEHKLGLEYDGGKVHGAVDALYRDRARQNELARMGWTLLRFTWWDVTGDTRRFVRTVADIIGR